MTVHGRNAAAPDHKLVVLRLVASSRNGDDVCSNQGSLSWLPDGGLKSPSDLRAKSVATSFARIRRGVGMPDLRRAVGSTTVSELELHIVVSFSVREKREMVSGPEQVRLHIALYAIQCM